MLKFTKYSIPVVMAGLVVLTGRTQEDSSQPQQQPAGAPPGAQSSSAQQQQQEQQRQQQQRQQQAQSQGQKERVSQEQRNQQSIFRPGAISDTELKKQVTEVNKASSFIGMAVKNTQNEDVGKINDLVFDPQKGRISYAVLSVGGILGVGDKLIAIPITSLKPQPGQKHLVLNMQKSQLEAAPGLAQNNWPDLDAPGLGGSAGSESGSEAASEQPTDPSSATGSPPSGSSETSKSPDQSSFPSSSDKPSTSASGSSPSTSSGSNSDSSQSTPASTDPSASSSTSATQGETKKTDE
jgi:sporulation protein YlmC with PRC-barrel domain